MVEVEGVIQIKVKEINNKTSTTIVEEMEIIIFGNIHQGLINLIFNVFIVKIMGIMHECREKQEVTK